MLTELQEIFRRVKENKGTVLLVATLAFVISGLIVVPDWSQLFNVNTMATQEPRSSCPAGSSKIQWAEYKYPLCVDPFGNPIPDWP